jgi:hypothetical protein
MLLAILIDVRNNGFQIPRRAAKVYDPVSTHPTIHPPVHPQACTHAHTHARASERAHTHSPGLLHGGEHSQGATEPSRCGAAQASVAPDRQGSSYFQVQCTRTPRQGAPAVLLPGVKDEHAHIQGDAIHTHRMYAHLETQD